MKNRFQIRELKFIGDKKESSIDFCDGLNVIYGKSNTGKSLIFLAIQYVFGKDINDEFIGIEELKNYHTICLTIECNDGSKYSIKRNIFDETDNIEVCNLNDNIVDYYRSKAKPTISSFLTNITSTEGFKLRSNAQGKLINYTFDKEMLISMISETKIIDNRSSPFLSGQKLFKTSELSSFLTIFTGIDDSKCDLAEKPQAYKDKLKSNINLLNELKIQLLNEINESISVEAKNENELEEDVTELKKKIFKKNQVLSGYIKEKKDLVDKVNLLESKSIFSQQIFNRFQLHKNNLKNDADRLEFIVEGNFYLDQLINTECPLCNSEINSDNIFNMKESSTLEFENLEKAYKKEFIKINTQLIDIEESIIYHNKEIMNIDNNIKLSSSQIKNLEKIIENEVLEDLDKLYLELELINNNKIIFAKLNEKKDRVTNLDNKISLFNEKIKKPTPKCSYSKEIDTHEINNYNLLIKQNLEEWNYSKSILASFDIDRLELSINSKLRTSNGKGHRAIQAASMVIAFLEYAIENEKIHPGFVILDSPLLSLRERETSKNSELISDSITNNFYEKLALKKNMQIIILENKEPPIELKEKANIIEFTKDPENGRYALLY